MTSISHSNGRERERETQIKKNKNLAGSCTKKMQVKKRRTVPNQLVGLKKLNIHMIRHILSYFLLEIETGVFGDITSGGVLCQIIDLVWEGSRYGPLLGRRSTHASFSDIFGIWGSGFKISTAIFFLWKTCRIEIRRHIVKGIDECRRNFSDDNKIIDKLVSQTESLSYTIIYKAGSKERDELFQFFIYKVMKFFLSRDYVVEGRRIGNTVSFSGVIPPSEEKKK